MHYCGIIIKTKDTTIEEARELLGEELVKKGEADWFSTDGYIERTFEDEKVKTLKEFKEIFEKWLKDIDETKKEKYFNNGAWPFAVVRKNYIDEIIVPSDFFEFYNQPEKRRKIINAYVEAYKKETMEIINKLLKDNENYKVVLLDYHN